MALRIVSGLAAITCFQRDLAATTCSIVPPCARVHVNSILFVGIVLDAGGRVQVEEVFAGLRPDVKEVIVKTEGPWLVKGHRYLIDAYRGDNGQLHPATCGGFGEVTNAYAKDVLDYLRQRARGETKTLLTVSVTDQSQPVSDVDVTISGPEGHQRRRTGAGGSATFDGIRPGTYRVSAARTHYHLDTKSHSDEVVEVLPGACAGSRVALEGEAVVSGIVRDAKGAPMASLELELITALDDPSEEISLHTSFFRAGTNTDGQFRFESVSPGRYFLGSNLIGLSNSVPRTYYPGQRTKEGAIPIPRLGETAENLLFKFPDYGEPRQIQVCVVDESGRPVGSAMIAPAPENRDFARLGKDLTTDETGCVKAQGYTRVAYSVFAILRPPTLSQIRVSDRAVIDPGEEPVLKILTLKPIGSMR